MKTLRATTVALAAVVLVGWLPACNAQEHPREHPREHPKEQPKEHPQEQSKEHPKKMGPQEIKAEFSKAVEAHIDKASKESEGFFVVKDVKLNREWKLKLDHIHKDKIVQLADDRFFACADFKGQDDTVDLDFFVNKAGDSWQVQQVLIHKVNGKPRYTYNDKNERVPVAEEEHKH